MASRRLSIVGLFDGRQPISNEDGTVSVVFNGELFDYPEQKADLEAKGHRFRTHCDTELIPHLWEEYGERMFDHLHGQFAVALWDGRQQRLDPGPRSLRHLPAVLDAAAATGCSSAAKSRRSSPRAWSPPAPDLRGINHVFTFFAMPGPVTCFEGIASLLPGHFLDIAARQPATGEPARTVRDRTYWEIDFPDRGQEEDGTAEDADGPLRGGDARRRSRNGCGPTCRSCRTCRAASIPAWSSPWPARCAASRSRPSPSASTTRSSTKPLEAGIVARHVGSRPTVVNVGAGEVLNTYPRLVARRRKPGHRHVLRRPAAAGPGRPCRGLQGRPHRRRGRRMAGRLSVVQGPQAARLPRLHPRPAPEHRHPPAVPEADRRAAVPEEWIRARWQAVGGPNPWLDIYGLVSIAKMRFFGPELRQVMADNIPYADLGLNQERLQALAPAQSRPLPRRPHPSARPAAERQGRPRGHALLGRDALSVPR